MKNYNYHIILKVFLIALLFASCEEDLNVRPQDKIAEDDFLNVTENAIQLVNGAYSKNLEYNMHGFSWVGVTSITSDDADKGSSPGDTGTDKNRLDALDFVSSSPSFDDVWKARFQGIGRANKALFYLEKFNIDPTLKNRLIGEVKFLRAMWYFDLVKCFGGVPIVTTEIDINDTATINSVVYTRKSKT